MSDASARSWRAEQIPTHLLTGMLGAGKTTALRHLISQRPAHERWAVLVNEFGDMGMDGDWLRETGVAVREVHGGCMGCTAAVTLRVELNRLLREAQPTRLLIEPTGLGHPGELLALLGDTHYQGVLDIAGTLCLIDPRRLREPRFAASPLWQQQLAAADRVVGSKAELWDQRARDDFRALQARHPALPFTEIRGGRLDLGLLLAPSAPVQPVGQHDHHDHDHDHDHHSHSHDHDHDHDHHHHDHLAGWHARGWQLPLDWAVSEAALRAFLMQMGWERVKGALRAPEGGSWRVDGVAGELSLTLQAQTPDNRLQVICHHDHRQQDWTALEARLRALGATPVRT
ncbi:MAG: GTP-binding protein [Alcanivorax sp.]|nr:GTP-binding protein [Alcanivorax sp.]